MLHRFNFVNLSRMLISGSASVSDTFATKNAGQPLEERVQIQALSVDLREAVMACLSGESPAAGLLWNWSSGLKPGRLRLTRQRDGGAGRTGARA